MPGSLELLENDRQIFKGCNGRAGTGAGSRPTDPPPLLMGAGILKNISKMNILEWYSFSFFSFFLLFLTNSPDYRYFDNF